MRALGQDYHASVEHQTLVSFRGSREEAQFGWISGIWNLIHPDKDNFDPSPTRPSYLRGASSTRRPKINRSDLRGTSVGIVVLSVFVLVLVAIVNGIAQSLLDYGDPPETTELYEVIDPQRWENAAQFLPVDWISYGGSVALYLGALAFFLFGGLFNFSWRWALIPILLSVVVTWWSGAGVLPFLRLSIVLLGVTSIIKFGRAFFASRGYASAVLSDMALRRRYREVEKEYQVEAAKQTKVLEEKIKAAKMGARHKDVRDRRDLIERAEDDRVNFASYERQANDAGFSLVKNDYYPEMTASAADILESLSNRGSVTADEVSRSMHIPLHEAESILNSRGSLDRSQYSALSAQAQGVYRALHAPPSAGE